MTITATNYAFEPKDVTIEPGTTVIWKNQTGRHTTVADDNKTFESPVLASGQEFRHTFASEGKYPYHCSLHEKDMKGRSQWRGVEEHRNEDSMSGPQRTHTHRETESRLFGQGSGPRLKKATKQSERNEQRCGRHARTLCATTQLEAS